MAFVFRRDVWTDRQTKEGSKKAGGKPAVCAITNYLQGDNGKAKPECIITFNEQAKTIIVIECKKIISRQILIFGKKGMTTILN